MKCDDRLMGTICCFKKKISFIFKNNRIKHKTERLSTQHHSRWFQQILLMTMFSAAAETMWWFLFHHPTKENKIFQYTHINSIQMKKNWNSPLLHMLGKVFKVTPLSFQTLIKLLSNQGILYLYEIKYHIESTELK